MHGRTALILHTLWIAPAMLACGMLAGMMSISAELQSYIWLPSGLGLAATLWLGNRAIPGVLLGGALIGTVFSTTQGLAGLSLWVVTLGAAAGSTLEAHLGRLLVWRYINQRAEIDSGKEMLGLLWLAPLIALISSSTAVATQKLGAADRWDDYLTLWLNMWIASALAIAFLTPLLLALRQRTLKQIAILGSILVAGTWLSYQLVISTSSQALESWENRARDEASQLTGLFVRSLQNGYGDMRAAAILLRADRSLTQDEFQDAVDRLHQSSEGFVPDALLVVTRDGQGGWVVDYSSDSELGLTRGYTISDIEVARDAIESSLDHGLVLGATTELQPGKYYGTNALAVSGLAEPTVVIGIQDVAEVDQVVAAQMSPGLGFAISSVHASGFTTEGRDHHYPEGKSSDDALVKFSIPMETAGAVLTFHWGVVEEYLGGPSLDFSRAIFFSGPLITLLIAVSINMLFAQAGRIRREVEFKTRELKKQTTISRQAVENMGEGILLVDAEGQVAAYNQLGLEYFGLTKAEVDDYPLYEDLLRYFYLDKFERPEELEDALREMRENKPATFDRQTADGKTIEVRHRPLGGLGFVRMFLDVTETRQSARELERAKALADMALDNMDEGLLMVDGEGKLRACNTLAMSFFGVTPEEYDSCATYEDIIRFVHTEKLKQPELIEERLAEARTTESFVQERHLPDGAIIEIRHILMEGGGFVRMYTDITERKRTAAELERQTTIAKMALENMDQGLVMADSDGKLTAFNKPALEIFGITQEEFSGFETYADIMRWTYSVKMQKPELIAENLAEVESNEPRTVERTMPDGRFIETRHVPLTNGGFIRMYSDVTERRHAAAELEEQKAMLDLALASMDEGLMLVDGEGRIKAWNDNVLETFMIDAETMSRYDTHDDLLRYLHMKNLGSLEYLEEDRANLKSTEPFVMERLVPDGTIWQTRFYPLEDGGYVTLYSDVTQRRADEEELIAARQVAEDSARSKSEFLANMSHEIRTPMNAIIGMSQLALKTELTPKQHNYIDKVHRSAVGLLGIINDILDFSKIEAGKLELEQLPFRLEEVMDNLVTLVGFRAEEKGLELLLDVAADVPRQLLGDPLRLGQILVNLANNAVKFTEEGEVVVSVRSLERSDENVQLEFSVKDTGIGMTVEEKARLFKAFSQADASTTRKFGGTGLGLTISKRLVDAMGGEISVSSKPDMGSEFRFQVQLGWQEDAGALPSASELDLDGLRVLVVDDNPTARTIFSELVSSLGFRADLAASGEEALELAAAAAADDDPYEVLLVDWQMPQMDGVATVQALVDRGLHPDAQTVLMVTAYGREEASEAGGDLPINSFLTKPLNASMLLDSVLMAQGRDALSHRLRQTGDVAKDYMAQLAGAHVLLVEDNDINQELALELLQGAGIKVDVANHGREALDRLAETDYDGVLMDIQMPVMDGYTATERIREQERFAELPVIAMTANALVGDRERALEVGMNDHIAKPLNVSTMFATLARWITPSVPATVTDVAAGFQPDAELPALTGIDTRAGLATCGGNRNLYVKLLRKFRDANQDFDAQFAAAEADDDADAPRRLAHTLKGTSASIGAGEVSLSAAELEAVCRPGEEDAPVEARRRAVVRALEPVLAALGEAEWLEPAQDESAAGPGIDPGAMAELRNLLENADTRAGQEAELLVKAGSESQRVLLQAIIEQIELFDFDAALEALTTMEQQLEATEATA